MSMKSIQSIALVWLLLFLLPAPLSAQPYELSFLVVRTRDGKVLYQQEPDKLRTPASTLKLVTTLALLEDTPLDHRFVTRLLSDSPPQNHKLDTLYLLGEADPELSLDSLRQLASELKSQGVATVRGDLVVDPGPYSFPPYGEGWAWDDTGHSYSPEISGLVLNDGEYPLDPEALPDWLHVYPDNTPSGRWMVPGQEGMRIDGPLPQTLAPPHAALRTGERLKEILKEAGVEVKGVVREGKAGGQPLAVHRSRPLREILKRALAVSDNLALELLYRFHGRRLPTALQDQQLRVVDGCGLSRYNLISVRQLVTVLRADRRLLSLLPRPGEGTLKTRFLEGWAAQQVAAKTGTLSNVSALAGYLFPNGDNECCFAVIINGHLGPTAERKKMENALVDGWAKQIAWPFLK